jgi:ATP-dependent DNA helicase RecQ
MFCLSRDQLYRLDHLEPGEDRVITSLLRNYGGLFVDYGFIDEAFIAHETGLTKPIVYQTLKQLAMKHIIRFIPQKHTPYIRYMQRREDSEYLMFPPAVYDDLKCRYIDRIQAMIAYLQTADQCRSRQLLRYFGEEESHDCKQCDVCLDTTHNQAQESARSAEAQAILDLLSDGKPHHITELRDIQLPSDLLNAALDYLFKEEYIRQEDGFITTVD